MPFLSQKLGELDRLLRGDATRPSQLTSDQLQISARGLAIVALILSMFYGLCMGSYSLLKTPTHGIDDPFGPYLQVLASMIKVPALFGLTLIITLPSLYVFNALVGSRLSLLGMMRLLVASLSINITVLAAMGTIVAFFSLTTTSYSFILLLNVAVFTVSGVLGLLFLLQTLHRLSVVNSISKLTAFSSPSPFVNVIEEQSQDESELETPSEEAATEPSNKIDDSALDMPEGQTLGHHTQIVFRCWIVLFSLVGAQMGWVLRPFIGSPDMPFTFFRARESNFFTEVFHTLVNFVLGGG
ncbi:hypothetical protein [Aeoliella mucimassa]|nr:hypothetical protein [Aeoliella mucimassa]